MIAKKIPRTKGTSSAARLVRYMVAAQGGLEPESWKRTADYLLDTKKTTTHGEKVASYRVTNCGTDDPAQATTIIEATQAANKRSKADKTYHLVFSFPPGEHPPLDVLHAIEDELCAAIGLADHQRISAVHQDTDHLHVHVAINKVHPTGLQNIEPFRDAFRLMEACERLEIKYGLTRTNHGLTEGKAYDRPEPIRLDPQRDHDTRFRAYLRQSYYLKIAEPPAAKTYNDLRKLPGSGVAHSIRRYSELLPGNAHHRLQQGRTERTDRVRRSGNGIGRDGERLANVTTGLPGNMEAHAGVESLIGYVAREVAPELRAATSWEQLHAALAGHGLQIKQRGAGLVIGDAGLGLWCKASDAGRDLSAKALTDRFGPFVPPAGANQLLGADSSDPQSRRRYVPRPRQQHPSSARLFAEYQRERQAAIVARRQGISAGRAEIANRREALKKWAATQRAIVKVSTRGAAKKMMYATIRAQVASQRAAISAEAAKKRNEALSATKLPSWNEWLMARAERGDVEALTILRSKAGKAEQLRGDLLTAERADRAKTVIMSSLKAVARIDGAMSYRTVDGGLVVDRTSHVQARQATIGAAFVALSLAAERFEGQVLQVRGSEAFRRDVARLAGIHGLQVAFADPALEAIRQAESTSRVPSVQNATGPTPKARATGSPAKGSAPSDASPPAPSSPLRSTAPQADAGVSPAVLSWIEKRNSLRVTLSSIDYNRLWEPKDAGPAIYQGRRKMPDGTEVLLLKRGAEMLVRPASANVVAKASRWRIGKQVTLDARGRFVGVSKGQEL